MIHQIRVEWGGLTAYVDRNLTPVCWDGGVDVRGGTLSSIWEIDPGSRSSGFQCIGHSLAPLPAPTWRSRTDQSVGGVVLELEGGPGCVVAVTTLQKSVEFTLGDLLARRYIRWPVGARYSGLSLCAMVDGEGPFPAEAPVAAGCLDARIRAADFKGATRYGRCVDHPAAWLGPGAESGAAFRLARAPRESEACQSAFLLEVRLSLSDRLDKAQLGECRYSPVTVRVNGRVVGAGPVYFRAMRRIPWMEFAPFAVPRACLRAGHNTITVRNDSERECLAVMAGQLRETLETDLEIVAAPRWLLAGDRCVVAVRALRAHPAVTIACRGGRYDGASPRALAPGLHRLPFLAGPGPAPLEIRLRTASARRAVTIPVYALSRETPSWKVGVLLACDNHDEASGEVDRALAHMSDTQMGNYVQFHLDTPYMGWNNVLRATPGQWRRWARLMKERGLYFSLWSMMGGWRNFPWIGGKECWNPALNIYEIARILKDEAGECFFSAHTHEYSHWVYGSLPWDEAPGWTMQDARERYVRLAAGIELIEGVPRQGGLATPLMGYDYEAGIDHVAVETMGVNAMHLFAAARGAARAFGKPVWGGYSAVYWCKAPDDFTKLTLNALNLYLTYAAGGRFTVSEGGHFQVPLSDHPQGFYSAETAGLRRVIREFYRYVHTHPRRGRPEVRLALAQGNHACELISFPLPFMTGGNQGIAMNYVWGGLGSKTDMEQWAFDNPERGVALLDEWMPYWQDGRHIRHWFTGTPFGAFDVAPAWKTDSKVLDEYAVLAFLGWNTMTPAIHDRLRAYVKKGGTLFLTIPHLSTRADRAFLKTMDDLRLIHGGDLRELCGVTIKGPGLPWKDGKAAWTPAAHTLTGLSGRTYGLRARDAWRVAEVALEPSARVLVQDAERGVPLLVEHRLGKGRAWLLTAWAYPGHPALEPLVRDILAELGRRSLGAVELEDFSREVAWHVWRDETGLRTVYLLNTDWTESGNIKSCRLRLDRTWIPVAVREGAPTAVTWRGPLAAVASGPDLYVEDITPVGRGRYAIAVHGAGRASVEIHAVTGHLTGADETRVRGKPCTRLAVRLDFRRATRREFAVHWVSAS